MKKISHVMQFRLSDKDNEALGTVSNSTFQMALDGYLSDGWDLFSFQTAGSNENGTMVVVLLTKTIATAK